MKHSLFYLLSLITQGRAQVEGEAVNRGCGEGSLLGPVEASVWNSLLQEVTESNAVDG